MTQPLISIIVPIYNLEKHLSRCIDSIIKQTYKNIEILLVDDGSTDSSGQIADQYSQADARIRVFHLKNGGVSSARNFGLKQMKGEYVAFIDGDDLVDCTYVEKLFTAIQQYNVEMSVCEGYECFDAITEYNAQPSEAPARIVYLDKDYDYTQAYAKCAVWGALYKRNLVENKTFPTDLYVGEDACFLAEILNEYGKYVFIPQKLYVYMIYEQSASHGIYTVKKRTEIFAVQRIKKIYVNKDGTFLRNVNAWYCWLCLNGMKQMIMQDCIDEEWYLYLVNEVRNSIADFMRAKYSLQRKMAGAVFAFFPHGSRQIYKCCKKLLGRK